MLSIAERHKYILDNLNKYGFVRITDVANELGVTKVTIRKDVKILESKGLLYKVHGSARPANPHVADMDVHVKDNINRDSKRLIAQRALELLEDNDSIIVASGSTIYAFAEEIKARQWHHLNIVTPFLRLGVLLNEAENVNVVQLGGTVHKKSLSVLGEEAARSLDDCICSKLFFGVDGIDLEHGITTSTIEEAKLTRRMMEAASQTSCWPIPRKFGQRGFGRICALEDIDVIITDDRISEQMVAIVEEAGVDLISSSRAVPTGKMTGAPCVRETEAVPKFRQPPLLVGGRRVIWSMRRSRCRSRPVGRAPCIRGSRCRNSSARVNASGWSERS